MSQKTDKTQNVIVPDGGLLLSLACFTQFHSRDSTFVPDIKLTENYQLLSVHVGTLFRKVVEGSLSLNVTRDST